MSVLAWDGETLACDAAANDGELLFPVNKLWVCDNKTEAFACVGLMSDVAQIEEWLYTEKSLASYPKDLSNLATVVIANKEKGLIRYGASSQDRCYHGFNYAAFGSGREFAYGALYCGAKSFQAVAAAVWHSPTCGGGIHYFNVFTSEGTIPNE